MRDSPNSLDPTADESICDKTDPNCLQQRLRCIRRVPVTLPVILPVARKRDLATSARRASSSAPWMRLLGVAKCVSPDFSF